MVTFAAETPIASTMGANDYFLTVDGDDTEGGRAKTKRVSGTVAAQALPWTTIHGYGDTASRLAASSSNAGYTHYNTDTGKLQRSNGTSWDDIAESGGGGGGGSLSDGDYGDITVSGSGSALTIDASAVTSTKLGGDVTTAGKALLTAADAAAQRTALGLGTAATTAASAYALAAHTHTSTDITDFTEAAQDAIAAMLVGGTDITVSYNDGANTFTINSTASGGGGSASWGDLGFFDITDYGGTGTDDSSGTDTNKNTNRSAWESAIAAVESAGGGTIIFPQHTDNVYRIATQVDPSTPAALASVPIRILVDKGVTIQKTGSGRLLDMGASTYPASPTSPDILDFELEGGTWLGLNTREAWKLGSAGGEDTNDNFFAFKKPARGLIHKATFRNIGNGLIRPVLVGEGQLYSNLGHSVSFVSATSSAAAANIGSSDLTATYAVGTVVKLTDTATSRYVTVEITSSSFGGSTTAISGNVTTASGTLPTTFNQVEYFIPSPGAFEGSLEVHSCVFDNVVQVITTNDSGYQGIHFHHNYVVDSSYVKLTSKGKGNKHHWIHDNLFRGCGLGVWAQNISNLTIENNKFVDCSLSYTGSSSQGEAIFLHFNSETIHPENMENVIVRNNVFENSGNIYVLGDTAKTISGLTIEGNVLSNPGRGRGSAGIYISGGKHERPVIRNNRIRGLPLNWTGILFKPNCETGDTHTEDAIFTGNVIQSSQNGNGIDIQRNSGSRNMKGVNLSGTVIRGAGLRMDIRNLERAILDQIDWEIDSWTNIGLLTGSRLTNGRIAATGSRGTSDALYIANTSSFLIENMDISMADGEGIVLAGTGQMTIRRTSITSSGSNNALRMNSTNDYDETLLEDLTLNSPSGNAIVIGSGASNWRMRGQTTIESGSSNIDYTGCLNRKTVAWNPASLASGSSVSQAVSVADAAVGKRAVAFPGVSLAGLLHSADCTGSGATEITIGNLTGGAIDLANSTWIVEVIGL